MMSLFSSDSSFDKPTKLSTCRLSYSALQMSVLRGPLFFFCQRTSKRFNKALMMMKKKNRKREVVAFSLCIEYFTCSRGLLGLCPVLWSYQARWKGMNFSPVHSASYISSHFSMSILCISIGQPDSLAIRTSEVNSCPAMQQKKKTN